MLVKRIPGVVRRSVALPPSLVEEVMTVAPEARRNLNRMVITALREFVAARKARAFEQAMARMAADPAIRRECAAIAREFAPAESDGLEHD
jgi:hypothetical protein